MCFRACVRAVTFFFLHPSFFLSRSFFLVLFFSFFLSLSHLFFTRYTLFGSKYITAGMDLLVYPEKDPSLLWGYLISSYIDHLTLLRPVSVFLSLLMVRLSRLPLYLSWFFIRSLTPKVLIIQVIFIHTLPIILVDSFSTLTISFTHSYTKLLPNPWIYCNLHKNCTFMNTKSDDQGLELNKMNLNLLDKENY